MMDPSSTSSGPPSTPQGERPEDYWSTSSAEAEYQMPERSNDQSGASVEAEFDHPKDKMTPPDRLPEAEVEQPKARTNRLGVLSDLSDPFLDQRFRRTRRRHQLNPELAGPVRTQPTNRRLFDVAAWQENKKLEEEIQEMKREKYQTERLHEELLRDLNQLVNMIEDGQTTTRRLEQVKEQLEKDKVSLEDQIRALLFGFLIFVVWVVWTMAGAWYGGH